MQAKYEEFLKQKTGDGCYLCAAPPLIKFKFWKIVKNEYPYDKISVVNHMIAPRRHCSEEELTDIEREEWNMLKNSMINECYDMIFENTHKKKSIPGHYHLQLIELQTEEAKESSWTSIKMLETTQTL
jgi:hypothetical protein